MAELRDGVYYLNAVIAYRLSTEAMDALHAGVPLGIRLDVEIIHPRRWWFDNDNAALRQSYQLEYHALSERYIVLNVNSGDQASFGSLFAALEYLGRVERLPLLDTAVLDDDRGYDVRLRAVARRRAVSGALAAARLLAARLVDRERVVSMAIAKRIRSAFLTLLAVFGILLWLVALLSFTRVTENTDDFAQRLYWILLINSVGITVLLALIVSNLWQLVRDHRRHVPGSRLRARMVSVLVMVAITPLVGVYIFSVEFINRGIDNWLNVDVEKGLERRARARRKRCSTSRNASRLDEVNRFARELADVDERRARDEAQRAAHGQRRASRSPSTATTEILGIDVGRSRPRRRRSYPTDEVLLAASPARAIRQRGAAARRRIPRSSPPRRSGRRRRTSELGFVQATFPMEQRLSTLANAVQGAYDQVGELHVSCARR